MLLLILLSQEIDNLILYHFGEDECAIITITYRISSKSAQMNGSFVFVVKGGVFIEGWRAYLSVMFGIKLLSDSNLKQLYPQSSPHISM